MKKILFIIGGLDHGGAERALSNILVNFPKGWEIDILLNSKDRIQYPYKGTVIELGVESHDSTSSLRYQIKVFLKRIAILPKLKRKNNYVACISFLDSANIANILTGNRHCKTIISVRNNLSASESDYKYKYIISPLVKLFYNRADKIIAVSKGVELDLKEKFGINPNKLMTIQNGYDIKRIQTLCQQPTEESDFVSCKNLIVTIGRLDEQKAQWHLIRAFREVVNIVPTARLLILGEGFLEKYLQNLSKECELEEHIIWGGFTKNPFQFVKKSRLFILASLYEGFPNALAEAVCCGIPCIAADFPSGAREILAPDMPIEETGKITDIVYAKYGILTPMCSGKKHTAKEPLERQEKQLAESILAVLQDNTLALQYQEKSLERSKELDIKNVVKKWIGVIEN